MKALRWHGTTDVSIDTVADPTIVNGHDAIIRITTTAICGSDLHIYNGYIPTMEDGDILGHEFMGEVIETGKDVSRVRKGERVVIPFTIACGTCHFCSKTLTSLCDNSNPNAEMAAKLYGYSASGLFGYSHLYGGFSGGQAEYVRVPFIDVGACVIPEEIPDEKVLFLSDILPTGWMAAENCDIQPGDIVAVWGCGPVGQFAIMSAFLQGAGRVIAIDNIPARLRLAETQGAETLNFEEVDDFSDALKSMTGGMGPHACIDAVGMEAHGNTIDNAYDWVKQIVRLETDRPHVLRQVIYNCRKGGHVSLPGVYGGFIDKFPIGSAFAKGLTLKMGQTNVHRYMRPLLDRIQKGEFDPSFVITHRAALEDAPTMYDTFKNNKDECIKVVLKP
ncbi:MAG: Alcohol dehydrogenase GroES domain protein [Chlorobi bacterium]|nr:Alcohol dehydrogenase GroES domain protein [Chlorobiota bacterium]